MFWLFCNLVLGYRSCQHGWNLKGSRKMLIQKKSKHSFAKKEWEPVCTIPLCTKGRGGDKFPDTVCNLNIPADLHGLNQFQHFWVKYPNAHNAAGQWYKPLNPRFAFGKWLVLLHRRKFCRRSSYGQTFSDYFMLPFQACASCCILSPLPF